MAFEVRPEGAYARVPAALSWPRSLERISVEGQPQPPPQPGFVRFENERTRSHVAAAATIRSAAAVWSWGDMRCQKPMAVPAWYTMNDKIHAAPVMYAV